MKYQIRAVKHLTDIELISKLIIGAKLYSQYVNSDLLFIFREAKSDDYKKYEVRYGKNNFMHLAGIKSATLTAEEFYDVCVNNEINRIDCAPCHDISNMHSKVSVLSELLDLKNSKCYKLGTKDLVTKNNDFEMATGNSSGVIGYDSRISKNGSKKINRALLPIPTTLLTNSITHYCTRPQKIMFVLQKNFTDTKYCNIFYEIKSGLLVEEYINFSNKIKNMIDISIT